MEGIEEAIGLFIQTLPVRTILTGGQTALSLLEELQGRQAARELHGHVGLTEIQGWSEVPRGTALFESLFVFENYPHGAPNATDASLRISGARSDDRTHYPLWLAGVPGRCITLRLSYDRGRFEEEAMARLLRHYQMLLEGIVAEPEQRISELALLTDEERRQLLIGWNETQRDYPKERCIHRLFEDQARRAPDAVAVVFEKQKLSYRELNARANQLACYLQGLGVGPEILVGICLERSVEMIVGLLGILKAGGAYVPLDAEYPKERLSFMVEDAGVSVVLVDKKTRARLAEFGTPIVCVDVEAEREAIAREPSENLRLETTPESAAYIIYTSGSTGRPKGVVIAHHNVVRLFLSTEEEFGFERSDVWTLFHS